MSDDELIRKMRSRAEQCRRLASMITDPHTQRVLRQMAEESEADIQDFEVDRSIQDNVKRSG